MFLTVIAVLVALSPIILIHELGHFLVCRLVGIKVLEFSFGFGKVLWSKKKGDTQYSVRAVPFGGFVQPAGEMFVDKNKETPKEFEFASKTWWKKFLMVVSGAAMNYVLAFVLFSFLVMVAGTPETDSQKLPATIGAVVTGYPAEKYGLQAGDQIVSVNGKIVANWAELSGAIASTKTDMSLAIIRGTQKQTLRIPAASFDAQKPVIGVQASAVYNKATVFGALKSGAYQCYYWSAFSIKSIYQSFAAKKAPDLAGPVGIVNIIHKAVHSSWVDFLWLVGLLSLAVGMFNLFPIPVLDGGYAVIFLWEGISGKLPSEKTVNNALNIGFIFIILLVIYATFGDVKRIFFSARADKPAAVETVETGK